MKNGPRRLQYFQDNWPTNKGAWFPGENVLYRGESLFGALTEKSWMTLLLYGITGRMPSEAEALMVEKLWGISTSFPDPRLWNNRVAALAGSARSTGVLAVSAATAVSEAKIFGAKPLFEGADFLRHLAAEIDNGQELEELVLTRLKRERYLPGFGRPIISRDERVVPLLNAAKKLGFDKGRYLSIVQEIDTLLEKKRYRIKPNIAIYCAAFLADMGFSPDESYMISVLTFSAGILPCYMDGAEKSEGALFPLTCSRIEYRGHPKRGLKNHEND